MARKVQPPDLFDVVHQFAKSPLACIADTAARTVLREQDFGWRPWIGELLDQRRAGPRSPARWQEKFWDSLSGYLHELVDPGLAPRFTDLLIGYMLVLDNETPGRNHKDEPTGITRRLDLLAPNWAKERNRELKRLRSIVGPPVTANPQRRNSLQLVIIAAMVSDLVASDISRKYACEELLPKIWLAIGVKVPSSLLRMERHSRQKT